MSLESKASPKAARPSRRTLLASAGLFTLGFHIPFPARAATLDAAPTAPEVNAWVVVKPDETVVIRIARSEMGQGTLTGLAQLVAEELDCDWARVTTEYPSPGQNLARKRVWGDYSTGGSRGVRDSHEYVRRGGAAARTMLVAAAAKGWGVPAAECRVERGVITHGPPAAASLTAPSPRRRPGSSRRRTWCSRIRRTGPSPASR